MAFNMRRSGVLACKKLSAWQYPTPTSTPPFYPDITYNIKKLLQQ
jgi:hypothetical protein